MTRRITKANLERQIDEINRLCTYLGLGRRFVLDGAYGGHRLEAYNLDGSCIGDTIGTGYTTKSKLYDAIYAFHMGLKLAGRAVPVESRSGEYRAN